MVEEVAANAPREAESMTSDHGTAVLRSPAPPGRLDHVAAWVAALACLPYLTLKTAWVAGSSLGIPPESPLLDHTLVLRLANAGTVVMDGAVIVLVLLLVRPWGLRAPGWLLLVPVWIATGLLLPIVLGYPAQLVAGALGAGGSGSTSGAEPFLDSWVFAVVYGGFIVQALALTTLFLRYAGRRWAGVARGRPGQTRAAGCRVTVRGAPPPGVLPPPLDREAYRIVQEGLANALKHAPGAPVLLRLERTASGLSVRVAQPLPPAPPGPSAGGGRGLAGVAERARLLGGSATAGPCGGDWVLDVTLPTGAAPVPRTGEENR